MIIETAIIVILLLKAFGILGISWTVAFLFVATLIVVEIDSILEKRRIMATVNTMISVADRKFDEIEGDIDSLERGRKYQDREERDRY